MKIGHYTIGNASLISITACVTAAFSCLFVFSSRACFIGFLTGAAACAAFALQKNR